jgi:hypothetical protein
MGAAIIDFRVCPPLVKCQNIMFSGFIDTLMYGFSSTGVTIYCYFLFFLLYISYKTTFFKILFQSQFLLDLDTVFLSTKAELNVVLPYNFSLILYYKNFKSSQVVYKTELQIFINLYNPNLIHLSS